VDRQREEGNLDRVETGAQRLGGVTGEDRKTFLGDGRATVDIARDEVDRSPGLAVAGREDGAVDPGSVEAGAAVERKQGRVEVDRATLPTLNPDGGEDREKSREDDQLNPFRVQLLGQSPGPGSRVHALRGEDQGREPTATGALDRRGVGPVGDHESDTGWEVAAADLLGDPLEGRPFPGNEDGDGKWARHVQRMTRRLSFSVSSL
jgi:hypothetical protein